MGSMDLEFKDIREENAVDTVIGLLKEGKHKKAKIKLGELRGNPEEFIKLFRFITKNTDLENAELKIKSVPARIDCLSCDWKGDPDIRKNDVKCPRCKSGVNVLSGGELQVTF